MFKSRFKGNEIKIIVYGQYLLNYETPIKEHASRLARRHYPVGASDNAMLDYLASSLTTIEGRYPGCGILLTGDFNRLNLSRLLMQFKLKQLVNFPTRGERTLDLIITNMPQLCDKNMVQSFPPFGLLSIQCCCCSPKRDLYKAVAVVL